MRLALAALILPLAALQDPPREASWFPTRVGTTWTFKGSYRMTDTTFTVIKPANVGDTECTVIEESAAPMGVVGRTRRYYHVQADKVVLLATAIEGGKFEVKPLDPPLTVLKLPPKAGDTWKHGHTTYKVEGPVKLNTPLGELDILKVRHDTDAKSYDAYAEGIGLVARVHLEGTRSESRLALASFKPGPEPKQDK